MTLDVYTRRRNLIKADWDIELIIQFKAILNEFIIKENITDQDRI